MVEVTANHLGYFEFRLCNTDNLNGDATQSCLNQIVLADSTGRKQFQIGTKLGEATFKLRLPSNLVCKHCVFQVLRLSKFFKDFYWPKLFLFINIQVEIQRW